MSDIFNVLFFFKISSTHWLDPITIFLVIPKIKTQDKCRSPLIIPKFTVPHASPQSPPTILEQCLFIVPYIFRQSDNTRKHGLVRGTDHLSSASSQLSLQPTFPYAFAREIERLTLIFLIFRTTFL